jgi:hypothetical protein
MWTEAEREHALAEIRALAAEVSDREQQLARWVADAWADPTVMWRDIADAVGMDPGTARDRFPDVDEDTEIFSGWSFNYTPRQGGIDYSGALKRAVVVSLAKADEVLDEVLYRPAVVKAFAWLPRWWLCDLAKLSVGLDGRWDIGYWDHDWIIPGGKCDACGRRASIHVYPGASDDSDDSVRAPPRLGPAIPELPCPDGGDLYLCGWCHLRGGGEDLASELRAAREDSVACRWRWRVRS